MTQIDATAPTAVHPRKANRLLRALSPRDFKVLEAHLQPVAMPRGKVLFASEIKALLEHPDIRECAVIGLPEDTWGEVVAAATVVRSGATLDLAALREWCRERLSAYKIPQRLCVVAELPRNAMGKVTKPAVRALFYDANS